MNRVVVAAAAVVLVTGAASWTQVWRTETAGTAAHRASGEALFRSQGCASCHDGPDSEAPIGGFPSLRAASSWAASRQPDVSARAYLAQSIRLPGAFTSPVFTTDVGPTPAMPQLGLDEGEIEAVVDYLMQG